MLSYLEAVQSLVESSVYGRGVRLYLEGKVLGFKDLALDYWRVYEIKGRDTYYVKIPLLHLALSQANYTKASEAIEQNVVCTCAYFDEYGACKHIVAVCARLEQEFNPKTPISGTRPEASTVLDTIFEVEVDKRTREWTVRLQDYLSRYNVGSLVWFEELALTLSNEYKTYKNFWDDLTKIFTEAVITWESEGRLVRLIQISLQLGGRLWWDFWRPILPELSENRLVDVVVDIWKLHILGSTKEFDHEVQTFLQKLTPEIKGQALEKLQTIFPHSKSFWLDFIFASQYREWLFDQYKQLDPLTLIHTCELLPELREEIEQRMLDQVKIWSDFLPTGKYDDIVEVFQKWQHVLGRSTYFDEALDYFRRNHKQKRKLLKDLVK